MLELKLFRKSIKGLPELIPYIRLVAPGVVANKDGSLMAAWEFRGSDTASPNSWRIEWQETVRNHVGITVDVNQYEATMTVVIRPPRTDAEILRNPGGVYITELSFGTVLSSNGAAKASQ
ncbi:hypothetical protein LJB99_07050 [Deltaproteobacteria bacterium OttesenSCG-928-K17]|nr:hypothetical protein [Deltaproteobacteria bacterium OttesenSCG-928-K17]